VSTIALPGVMLPVDFALSGGDFVVADAAFRAENADQRPGLLRIQAQTPVRSAFCPDQTRGQAPVDRTPRPYEAVEPAGPDRFVALSLTAPHLRLFSADGKLRDIVAIAETPAAHEGRRLFHSDVGAGIACASCHPEGMDDGVAWNLDGRMSLRTHYLRGGLVGTEPLHWRGEIFDFHTLMESTMGAQMGAGRIRLQDSAVVYEWLEELPLFPAPLEFPESFDRETAEHGAGLFHDMGCANCHPGGELGQSTAPTPDGLTLQPPRLTNLRYRAPYMHNGCAETLDDVPRCGNAHRSLRDISSEDWSALRTYLELW